MTTHRSPFRAHAIADAIARREARSWVEKHLPNMIEVFRLGEAKVQTRHRLPIFDAFMAGAYFEIERLSKATRTDFREMPSRVIHAAAQAWFDHVKRSSINTCSITQWQHVLHNSFEVGSQAVREYLFPPSNTAALLPPHRHRRKR